MKKIYILMMSLLVLSVGWYLHSQDESNKKQEKVNTEPVATSQATKRLLMSLDTQIVALQKKISEHSERLGGVFAKWKKEGKIKQAEQWNQVRAAINTLLSEVKIILQDFDRIEKLRRNQGLFDALSTLVKQSRDITPKSGDMRYIMQSSSLYGKNIFNDKILEEIKKVTEVKAPEKKEAVEKDVFVYGPEVIDADYEREFEDFSFDGSESFKADYDFDFEDEFDDEFYF